MIGGALSKSFVFKLLYTILKRNVIALKRKFHKFYRMDLLVAKVVIEFLP